MPYSITCSKEQANNKKGFYIMDNHMLGNLILLLSLPAGWLVSMAVIESIENIYKKFFK